MSVDAVPVASAVLLALVVQLAALLRPQAWRSVLRVGPALVGCAVLLVAVDLGAGEAWDHVRTEAARGGDDDPDRPLPPTTDPLADTPAMAGSPWADRYFAESQALPSDYVPFLGPRDATFHGRYLNTGGGIRRSYEPAASGGREALEVWFFGGSTMWGEGQRDLHTIPSEVARLAEDDGVRLHVVNFGQRGYTAFQELLLFEQELAQRPSPDLAVFYHGANEMASLLEAPENLGAQPSTYQIEVIADAFHRAPPLPGEEAAGPPTVLADYGQTSLLGKVWRWATSLPNADAQEQYVPSNAHVERALVESAQIYRRSVRLIRHEGEVHGVPEQIFWQPMSDQSFYDELGRQVADVGGGIDISQVLRDERQPVFLDAVHTNELGARIVAEAIWRHLAPTVAGLKG